jgi:hypothetical protein
LKDGELRLAVDAYVDGRELTLRGRPDATLVIEEAEGQSTALVLEMDRGTMPAARNGHGHQSSFLKKCRLYAALWRDERAARTAFETDDFIVLTVVPNTSRLETLRAVARSADSDKGCGDLFWFTNRERLSAETALVQAIWTTAAGFTGALYGDPSETAHDIDKLSSPSTLEEASDLQGRDGT